VKLLICISAEAFLEGCNLQLKLEAIDKNRRYGVESD
jgi:hypothetical protein